MIFHSFQNPGKGELEPPETFDEALSKKGEEGGKNGGRCLKEKILGDYELER